MTMALPQLLLRMAGLRIPRIRRARRMFLPTIQKTKVSTLIKKGAIQMMAQDYKRLGQMTRSLFRVQRAAKGISTQEMEMLEDRAEASVAAAELMEEDKPEEAFAVAPEIEMDRDSNYIANQGGKVAVGVDVEIINPDTLEKKKVTWTLIFDERPDLEALRERIKAYIGLTILYPGFEDYHEEGMFDFDWDIFHIEQVV